MADKAITIDVELELSGAEHDLDNLRKNIRSLDKQLNVATRNKELHLFNVENTEREIATLKEQFNSLFKSEGDRTELINPEDAEKADYLTRQLEVLENLRAREERAAIRATQEEKNIAGALEQEKQKYVELAKSIESSSSSLKAVGVEAFEMLKTAVSDVIPIFKQLANIVVQAGKTVVKWGGQIAKTLWSLPFTNFRDTDKSTASLKDLVKYVTKYVFGFRSFFYLYRRFRSEVKEGFENLAKYSETVNYAISDVVSAFNQLKNAIATALAPIVTVGAPILSQFLQLCSKAANELARITAMLTGQTSYVKANYVWEDYAESLEDASSASEKFLASFDTLEKLNNSSSSSDSTDVSEMFETVEITPFDFSSWGEALDYFLDWLNDEAIPSLEDTFGNFADWLNNLMGNIVEMFTYGDNQYEIKTMAANLAEQLNGLVDDIDWDTIGQAIGEAFNAALGWLNTFVGTFNWFALGQSIASGINEAVETINWKEVGRWLWNKFLIAIEFFAGLITGGDTGAWAEAASDIIIAFYNDMTDTIDDIDWETVGQKIREFVEGIKWEEIGYAMQGGIEAAFDAIEKADLAGTLGSLLANIFNWAMSLLLGDDSLDSTLTDQANEFFEGNLDAIMSQEEVEAALEKQNSGGLISQITSFVNRFIEVFKEEFDTDKWEEVSTQISEALSDVITWAKDIVLPIVADIGIEIGKALLAGIAEGLYKSTIGSLTDWVGLTTNNGTELANSTWEATQESLADGVDYSAQLSKIGEKIKEAWNEFWAQDPFTGGLIGSALRGGDSNDIEKEATEIGESAGEGFNEGVESAVEGGASKTASSVASAMTGALKSALSIHSPSALIGEEVGEPSGQGLLDYFADLFTDLSTWAKEKVADPLVNSIKDTDMFSTDTWKSFGETAMSGLIDAFESGFNSIISGLNSLMSQVSSAVSQMSSMMSTVTGTSGLVLSTATYSRLNSISLPALAEGAVIPPNREFMAVLGDQKSGVNIETPLNTMVEAFKQAMRDSDFGGGNMTTVLEVDGVTLGSVVYNMNKKESQRIGTNLVTNR